LQKIKRRPLRLPARLAVARLGQRICARAQPQRRPKSADKRLSPLRRGLHRRRRPPPDGHRHAVARDPRRRPDARRPPGLRPAHRRRAGRGQCRDTLWRGHGHWLPHGAVGIRPATALPRAAHAGAQENAARPHPLWRQGSLQAPRR
nr:hypothetical protein [Tanacetum cinerariifolium]